MTPTLIRKKEKEVQEKLATQFADKHPAGHSKAAYEGIKIGFICGMNFLEEAVFKVIKDFRTNDTYPSMERCYEEIGKMIDNCNDWLDKYKGI